MNKIVPCCTSSPSTIEITVNLSHKCYFQGKTSITNPTVKVEETHSCAPKNKKSIHTSIHVRYLSDQCTHQINEKSPTGIIEILEHNRNKLNTEYQLQIHLLTHPYHSQHASTLLEPYCVEAKTSQEIISTPW